MKHTKFYEEARMLVVAVEQHITYTAKRHLRVQVETVPGEIFPVDKYSIMLEDRMDGYILILNRKTGKQALKDFKITLAEKAKPE